MLKRTQYMPYQKGIDTDQLCNLRQDVNDCGVWIEPIGLEIYDGIKGKTRVYKCKLGHN